MMRRLLPVTGLPSLPEVFSIAFAYFERLISLGGAVPVAAGALIAYLLLIGRPATRT